MDFEKSYMNLKNALKIKEIDEVYRAGIIKIFELTFELAWKTLKDLLTYEGHSINTPRETIRQAYQDALITEGHKWIDLLEKRNVFVHTYDEQVAIEAEKLIREEYFELFTELYETLKRRY